MTNRPVNFNDPTGHAGCDGDYQGSCADWAKSLEHPDQGDDPDPDDELSGGGSGDGGSNNCDTNNNGVPDIPCPGLTTRDRNDNRITSQEACLEGYTILECYYLHASIKMGQDPMYISREDFLDLLQAIYYEINGREPEDLIVTSMNFDTPFFDRGIVRGLGAWPGTACIDGIGCFARHEINYIAQGEISAAAGETKMEGLTRVVLWKAIPGIGQTPSDGTFYMWKIGYIFYHGVNGSIPPP